ncbi:NTP transferase domain-containing protein [Altererythrobacter salegens]|uniref:NTP transferase domain-containing protein n=1 Tax=Croceibacterium salegens TaxID=1737568 RepID=A0A6I4SWM5_9SPHN|nr:NTP transferase domain-containing protein [Croceibacterium salegens]
MSAPVLILAGSRPDGLDPIATAEDVPHKALARVGGLTLLERAVAAARAWGASEVLVAANNPAVEDEVRRLGATLLPTASGPSGSVALAFERTGAPLLVTTADHALLEPGWLAALVAGTPADADVSLMLARREAVEAAAPGSQRTWLSLADGDWSGCNLFYLASAAAPTALATWRRVEADRKRPWRIAARLGWGTLWNFLRGKLTMAEAVARIGQRIGITAALVAATDGRAAIDVDKPADLALVRALAEAQ